MGTNPLIERQMTGKPPKVSTRLQLGDMTQTWFADAQYGNGAPSR
jgi:hypothetical protein